MQCKRCSYSDWHTTILNFRNHGQLVGTLSGHTSWVLSVAYSPDNEHFVSSSADHTVRVWKESTRQCIHTFSEHTDQVFLLFKTATYFFIVISFCNLWFDDNNFKYSFRRGPLPIMLMAARFFQFQKTKVHWFTIFQEILVLQRISNY